MESEQLVLSQNNVCRTCLTSESDLVSLFDIVNISNKEETLNSILLKCTSIQVTRSDVYPQVICSICLEKLSRAHLFREQCFLTHERLGQIYQNGNFSYTCPQEDTSQLVDETVQGDLLFKDETIEKNKLQVDKPETFDDGFEEELQESCDKQYNIVNENDKEDKLNSNSDSKIYNCDNQNFGNDQNCETQSNTTQNSNIVLPNFTCTECGKIFWSRYTMHRHMKIHSNSERLKCTVCAKQFSRVSDVKRHMFTHTGDKPFLCVVCQSSFTQSSSLAVHMRRHEEFKIDKKPKRQTEDKPHLCSICGMSFKHSSSLTIHIRRHIGDKPYCCTVCNMRFVSSGRLTSHMRVHTGERPFSCSICGKCFAQSSVAGQHMKSHADMRPHQCPYCPKTFSTVYYLNIHKRQHTGEKPFKCQICQKTFSDPKNLKQHKNIHTEEKPYLCIICGKPFRRGHHLKNHMNIHAKATVL